MPQIIGAAIAWEITGLETTYPKLRSALAAADLDPDVARDFVPANAFRRACHTLRENRVIRELEEYETEDTLVFQFTRESKDDLSHRFDYEFEAQLTLDKATGRVTCDSAELAARATELIAQCMTQRCSSDITRIIQRLFRKSRLGIFAIVQRGGFYFVPKESLHFVDKIGMFLAQFDRKLARLDVSMPEDAPAGAPPSDNVTVKQAVERGLTELVRKHLAQIEKISGKTRTSTIDGFDAKFKETEFEISIYAQYLGDMRDKLDKAVQLARKRLREKVNELSLVEV